MTRSTVIDIVPPTKEAPWPFTPPAQVLVFTPNATDNKGSRVITAFTASNQNITVPAGTVIGMGGVEYELAAPAVFNGRTPPTDAGMWDSSADGGESSQRLFVFQGDSDTRGLPPQSATVYATPWRVSGIRDDTDKWVKDTAGLEEDSRLINAGAVPSGLYRVLNPQTATSLTYEAPGDTALPSLGSISEVPTKIDCFTPNGSFVETADCWAFPNKWTFAAGNTTRGQFRTNVMFTIGWPLLRYVFLRLTEPMQIDYAQNLSIKYLSAEAPAFQLWADFLGERTEEDFVPDGDSVKAVRAQRAQFGIDPAFRDQVQVGFDLRRAGRTYRIVGIDDDPGERSSTLTATREVAL